MTTTPKRGRGRPPLPIDLATAKLSNVRLAASTSLTEEEILALDALLSVLRRGGDARTIARSPAITKLTRKVLGMKLTLERQHERRAAMAARGNAEPEQVEPEQVEELEPAAGLDPRQSIDTFDVEPVA